MEYCFAITLISLIMLKVDEIINPYLSSVKPFPMEKVFLCSEEIGLPKTVKFGILSKENVTTILLNSIRLSVALSNTKNRLKMLWIEEKI